MAPENPANPIPDTESSAPSEALLKKAMWKELRTIYDPEIPVNIVDLGLIYSAEIAPAEKGSRVNVRMSLTAPGCSMSEVLKAEVERKVSQVSGISEVHVEVVFDPPWHPGMMSEAAKLALGFDSDFGAPNSGSSSFNIIR